MNRESVNALIHRHYPGLLLLLRGKLRDDQLAKDVLNQALVTSLEHVDAGRVSDPAQIAGYVYQVAMNHLRNHRRKMDERGDRRVDAGAIDAVAADAAGNPESHGDFARHVAPLIAGLPTARDREIVKRFYLDEEEKDTICRDLGLSALHFDKVIFRARQRMRALLEAKGLKKSDFFGALILCAA